MLHTATTRPARFCHWQSPNEARILFACIEWVEPTLITPTSTRVVACRGGDATGIEQRPLRALTGGELLLSVSAVGLCGTDLFKLDTGAAAPGTVLGHELVGIVQAMGPEVGTFGVGDRVAVAHHVPCGRCEKCRRGSETLCEIFRENLMEPGGFADHVIIHERAVSHAARRVPKSLSDDVAVWLEPAACVLRGVERANLFATGAVAVFGAGSMGLLHLLVLKARYPALRVLMVDLEPTRLALAENLGADATCVPHELQQRLAVISNSLGADAVFDTVGGSTLLEAALEATREGGAVVLFAHAGDGERADFVLNDLFKHERRIMGSYSGTPDEQARVFQLMLDGRLDPSPLVTHRMDLSRFREGIELVRARRAIKVVFTGTADPQ